MLPSWLLKHTETISFSRLQPQIGELCLDTAGPAAVWRNVLLHLPKGRCACTSCHLPTRHGHVKDMAKDSLIRPGKRVCCRLLMIFLAQYGDIHGYQLPDNYCRYPTILMGPRVLIGFWSIPKVFINFSDCQGGLQSCLSMVLRYKDPRSPDRREWLDYDQVRIH